MPLGKANSQLHVSGLPLDVTQRVLLFRAFIHLTFKEAKMFFSFSPNLSGVKLGENEVFPPIHFTSTYSIQVADPVVTLQYPDIASAHVAQVTFDGFLYEGKKLSVRFGGS